MKKCKRLLSLALVFMMFFVHYLALPVQALADGVAQTKNAKAYNAATEFSDITKVQYSQLVGEDESGREESTKVFHRRDGAMEAVVYGNPVHYMEDGKWKARQYVGTGNGRGRQSRISE